MNEYLDMLGYANEADEGDKGDGVFASIGKGISAAANAVVKAIKSVIQFIWGIIKKIGNWIKTGAQKLWEKVKGGAHKFAAMMKSWAAGIKAKLGELKAWLAKTLKAAKDKAKSMYDSAKAKVTAGLDWIKDQLERRKAIHGILKTSKDELKALDTETLSMMNDTLKIAQDLLHNSEASADADPALVSQVTAAMKRVAAAFGSEIPGGDSADGGSDASESISNLDYVLRAARNGDYCAAIESLVDAIQYGSDDMTNGASLLELEMAAESAIAEADMELSIAL